VTNLNNKKMLIGFSHEVRSYLPSIREDIEGYRHDAGQSNTLEEALRHLHTIKGASALMGLSALSRLITCVQELLENVLAGQAPLDNSQETWLNHSIDRIEPYLDALLDGDIDDQGFMEEIEQSYSALQARSETEDVDTGVADEAPDATCTPDEDLVGSEGLTEAEAIQYEEQPAQTEDFVFEWSRDVSESQHTDATESTADDILASDDGERLDVRDHDASADEIEQTEAALTEPESEPEGGGDGTADETPHTTESESSPIDVAMHGNEAYAQSPGAEDDEFEFSVADVDDIHSDIVWADAPEFQKIETFTLLKPADTCDEPSSQDSLSSGECILSGYDLTGSVEKPPAASGALDELIESIDHEVHKVYHYAALSTSRQPPLAYMKAVERYVTFAIADSLYAVSVTSVLEISRVPRITPIPNVPSWIPGVINLRGEIISVIDLRAFLGIDETYQAYSRRLLVVKTPGEEITTSLVVDQVRGFVRLDTKQMTAAGTSLDDWVAPYLTGVFEYEDQVLAVMDLERFLLSPEICQFD
jgi:purine-binding chemotaxis protein CheW